MELKKNAQGNHSVEVDDGKGKILVTYIKKSKEVQVSGPDGTIACAADQVPTLIEALAAAYTQSVI